MAAVPGADYLVMATYYLAQFLIVLGFLSDESATELIVEEEEA